MSEQARNIWWRPWPLSRSHTWWVLHLDHERTPWQIVRDRRDRGPTRRTPYCILGAGMDPDGHAKRFAYHRTMKEAKAEALALALAKGEL